MKTKKLFVALAALSLVLAGCNNSKPSDSSTDGTSSDSQQEITGTVTGPKIVAVGQEVQFSAEFNVEGEIAWSSSDPAVATVSTTGLVKGVAVGNATITATLGEGSASLEISVAKRAYERTTKTAWSSSEAKKMEDALNTTLPFMQFGKNYTVTSRTISGDEYVFVKDTFISDLTAEYAAILVENGYEEDLEEDDVYYLSLPHGNEIIVELNFDPQVGNEVAAYLYVNVLPSEEWPAEQIADHIGDLGHGLVIPECVANPPAGYYPYVYYWYGDFMLVYTNTTDITIVDEYMALLQEAGMYAYYDDGDAEDDISDDAIVAFTWEQDVIVFGVIMVDEAGDFDGLFIQILVDPDYEAKTFEWPTASLATFAETTYSVTDEAYVEIEDLQERGFDFTLMTFDEAKAYVYSRYPDYEYYVQLYMAFLGYTEMEALEELGLLALIENYMTPTIDVYDPDGLTSTGYLQDLQDAGWHVEGDNGNFFAISPNEELQVVGFLDQVIFEVKFNAPVGDAHIDAVNDIIDELAAEGTNYYMPDLLISADDSDLYADYLNEFYFATTSNQYDLFNAALISQGYTPSPLADDETGEIFGYLYLSPDQQFYFVVQDLLEYGYMYLAVYPADFFEIFPSVRLATILDVYHEGTTAIIPEFTGELIETEDDPYVLEDNAPDGGITTLTFATSEAEYNTYLGKFNELNWTTETDLDGVTRAVSEDKTILVTLTHDSTTNVVTLTIEQYFNFTADWPADAVADYLGEGLTDTLPEYTGSLTPTYYFKDGYVYAKVADDAAAATFLEEYEASLVAAGFVKDTEYEGTRYMSANEEMFVVLDTDEIQGNTVVAIKINKVQYFPLDAVLAWVNVATEALGYEGDGGPDFSFLTAFGGGYCSFEVKDGKYNYLPALLVTVDGDFDLDAFKAALIDAGYVYSSAYNDYEFSVEGEDFEFDVDFIENSDGTITIRFSVYEF